MIKLKLGEMLTERNMSAYALHKESGLHQSVISKIKNNDSKALTLSVLDTLCEYLDCQPADLIVYESGKPTQPVDATQIVERATQNVKQSALVVDSSELKTITSTEIFDRMKEKISSGKGFSHSVLDIVHSSSDNETLLSTADIAQRLGINERTVRDNYNNGKLPFVKRGTKNLVRESDFIVFRDSRNSA
jgi:putative transcriptional regulator